MQSSQQWYFLPITLNKCPHPGSSLCGLPTAGGAVAVSGSLTAQCGKGGGARIAVRIHGLMLKVRLVLIENWLKLDSHK